MRRGKMAKEYTDCDLRTVVAHGVNPGGSDFVVLADGSYWSFGLTGGWERHVPPLPWFEEGAGQEGES